MLDKLKLELVPAAGDKLVLKLSPPPPPLADKQACAFAHVTMRSHLQDVSSLAFWLTQASLAGNMTVNAAGGEAAGIPSEGKPASLEDVIPSEQGKPASLEYVGVVFAASVGASFAGAETSRRLTFTVDKTSCPPLPSPPLSVIDSAGGKHDGISSKSEPASLNDVIGNGNDVPSESAPTAPVGITSLSPSLLGAEVSVRTPRAHSVQSPRLRTAASALAHRRAASRTTSRPRPSPQWTRPSPTAMWTRSTCRRRRRTSEPR